MRKILVAVAAALVLGLLVSLSVVAGQLDGTWTGQVGPERWVVRFSPDGTFSRQVTTAGKVHQEQGRYQVQGYNLLVRPAGDPKGYTLQFRLATADILDIYEDGKHLARLQRYRGQAPVRPAAAARGQAPPASTLRPQGAYPAAGGSSIVYTRYEMLTVNQGRTKSVVPTPKLFIMDSDGSRKRPYLYPLLRPGRVPQLVAGLPLPAFLLQLPVDPQRPVPGHLRPGAGHRGRPAAHRQRVVGRAGEGLWHHRGIGA